MERIAWVTMFLCAVSLTAAFTCVEPGESLQQLQRPAAQTDDVAVGRDAEPSPPSRIPTATLLEQRYGISPARAGRWALWIDDAAGQSDVPTELLIALVAVESSFRLSVTSSRGAVGPAQIRPHFHMARCESGFIEDPALNIRCAGAILRHYHDTCGRTWEDALACYNVGPSGRKEPGGPEAVARYIAKITAALDNQANILSAPRSLASL